MTHRFAIAALLLAFSCSCVATGERALRADLHRARETLADLPRDAEAYEDTTQPNFDGTPDAYVEYALAHDGGLRAMWERWRAETWMVARERRLPMPEIEYTVFVTRVAGPERQRLMVRQMFPWPGELLAGADAAVAEARVMQREFEVEALQLRFMVLERYWDLWMVRRMRTIQREQLELLDVLVSAAEARLAVGRASVADVQQIELARAWLRDELIGADEAERQAEARLIAVCGAPPETPAPTVDRLPSLERPSADETELRAVLDEHPRLRKWDEQQLASELRVRQARNARAPMFSLGTEWMQMEMPGAMPRSAVSVSVGVSVPLWQRNYAAEQRAFEAAAARAEWAANYASAAGELGVALSSVRDSARRARLYEVDLVPRAETVLDSLLSNYASGQGELAAILLAQRDVWNLQLELVRHYARHAMAWAELEAIVGQPTDGEAIDLGEPPEQAN
jgi:cobalt-zinc-cadmium efflux system outer membrane protein